ncbi:MAG: hypothetical protein HYZ38_17230 [Mycobacterium sp.]|nr:hypothetical protein [Mycobacterium sp.]
MNGRRTIAALAILVTTALQIVQPTARLGADPGCGWSPVGNTLFPDLNARYWKIVVPLRSGQQIRISGQFPHARYMAYALQGPGGSGDAVHDTAITPDAGSSNPFLAGADRNTTARSYSLRIAPGTAPASGRPVNTLYSGEGAIAEHLVTIIYRIYDVDAAADQATGGGLPTVATVDAAGTVARTCTDNHGGVTPGASFAPVPAGGDRTIGAVGTNPPSWQKFVNTATVYTQILHSDLLGDAIYDRVSTATSSGAAGGLGANVDNQYVSTLLNPNYGRVLALTAAMPTHPDTYQGQSPMGAGQVRYWSMCTEILATTQAVRCLPDHAVPVRADGTFTIVVSAPQDRPRNASEACGVAWLPMGTVPGTVLLMRNMLADPGFAQGIGNAELNHEADTMGAYYPRGQYFRDAAAYEATGCTSR